VPKILVADDNSNIQKMVGLALKDQGIDVVAVGNGEAAVRRIADVRPDLVLADVFMPVRNGYEVCQYVKADSALSHIPVILLVGAFDPLDEQEAQRVGADGVLKKPFVPPDPLISMVKAALQRAAVSHGDAGKKEPEPLKATDLLEPSRPNVPTLGAIPVLPGSHEELIAASNESFVDEVPERPEPVRIGSGSQPVAFGSLLETPAEQQEEPANDTDYMPSPELAGERDWRDPDLEEASEEEEEEKPEQPWRHEEGESHSSKKPSGGADWRSGSFEQILARRKKADWEPEEEKPEAVETAPVASPNAKETPAAPVIVPSPTPAIPAPPFAGDAWAQAGLQAKGSAETAMVVEDVAHKAEQEHKASEAGVIGPQEAEHDKGEKKAAKDSWFSVTSNPWDAEIDKANQLASGWDAVAGPAAPASSNGTERAAEPVSEATQAAIEQGALPPAAVEAIREEAAQVAEHANTATEKASGEKSFYAREKSVEPPAATPSIDELVAKVLAKMSPEVLQAVTREILKPVVEAMVKEELNSKKP